MSQLNLLKTLVTGGHGMVGSYIDFGIKPSQEELDVTDPENVFEVINKYRPKNIIHLAAATDLKQCEEQPDYAYRVNSLGTYYIALAARSVGAKLVYVSTGSVFDGSKVKPYSISDTPNPQNVYSRSKYLGELAVKGLVSNHLIVRTCWIFGGGRDKDKKLVGKIMEQIRQKFPQLKASKDHIGSPTYGKDLVMGIKKLLSDELTGTFHIANSGSCSRVEEVEEILKINGLQLPVEAVPASDFGLSADRLHESLEPYPALLRPWQHALKEYIETEW